MSNSRYEKWKVVLIDELIPRIQGLPFEVGQQIDKFVWMQRHDEIDWQQIDDVIATVKQVYAPYQEEACKALLTCIVLDRRATKKESGGETI